MPQRGDWLHCALSRCVPWILLAPGQRSGNDKAVDNHAAAPNFGHCQVETDSEAEAFRWEVFPR
jgi:hypothetical protein